MCIGFGGGAARPKVPLKISPFYAILQQFGIDTWTKRLEELNSRRATLLRLQEKGLGTNYSGNLPFLPTKDFESALTSVDKKIATTQVLLDRAKSKREAYNERINPQPQQVRQPYRGQANATASPTNLGNPGGTKRVIAARASGNTLLKKNTSLNTGSGSSGLNIPY